MGRKRGTRIETIAALDMETFKPMFGFGRQHFGAIAKAMGVRFPSVFSTTFIGPLPANANETIVMTTPPLNISLDFAPVYIIFSFGLITGVGSTAHLYNIRRGATLSGAFVTSPGYQFPSTAGAASVHTAIAIDTPGAVAGQQYTLTVQQIGATGAGTFNVGALLVFSL